MPDLRTADGYRGRLDNGTRAGGTLPVDAEALRELLAHNPLASGGADEPLVFAVDASVWPRCDAETSPERGFYYHPSRHSAGQPIVAGWAYQFVAQLGFVRESWTAPVDVRRVRADREANAVAAEQIGALLGRLEGGPVPLFVFDAGYDPVKLQRALERHPCQILVRLGAGRRFYGDPGLCDPPAIIGRPRRHGPKMKCNDPSTWPEPSTEHHCEDAGYGSVCGPGRRCTRRSRTTRGGAVGDPCPSWLAHSSRLRSSVCPAARGGASRGCYGCGGTGLREPCRIWTSSGEPT